MSMFRTLKRIVLGEEQKAIPIAGNAEYYEIVRSLELSGDLGVMNTERMRQLRADGEMRAMEAGLPPLSRLRAELDPDGYERWKNSPKG